jgi:hypothetical protein
LIRTTGVLSTATTGISWIIFTANILILSSLIIMVYCVGEFQEFDYGPMKNMEYYGQSEPPNYNLKNITAPMSLHYGTGDLLVSLEVS